MKETTEGFIKDFLKQQHREGKEYIFGGVIEDYLRTKNGSKGETTSRICRFMVEDNLIEPVYIPREKGKANVAYKLKDENVIMSVDDDRESKEISMGNSQQVYPSEGFQLSRLL